MTALLGITRPYDASYFNGMSSGHAGAGTSFDISLGGRPYMLDLIPESEGGGQGYQQNSLPLLQRYFLTQDTGNIGEQSLNPLDYWRRSADSWQNGAGQLFNDRDTSVRTQFHASKGMDCWTPGQITLLNDTTQVTTSANDNLELVVAGTELYMLDGTALSSAPDGVTFAPLTGTTLSSPTSIASDGYTIWVVDATDTYYATRGGGSYTTWFGSPLPGSLVRIVKGRLFVFAGNVINTSTFVPGSAVSSALYTQPNSDFTWVDATSGPTAIYFAGFSGDQSLIYQTAVVSDGTNLNIPAVAAELPSGEIVRCITAYLGVLMIGTDLGVRVAAIDSSGNLTVGDLIPTGTSVQAFEAQSHFVWFGWNDFDGTSTGLGRVDLGVFNNTTPAYASDLMATGSGVVSSIVTYGGVRYFTVEGSGLWAEDTDRVPTGYLTSGQLNYSLPDPKIAIKYDISYLPGEGSITASLATDNTTYVQMGAAINTMTTTGGNSVQPAGLKSGLTHEVKLTFTRGTDTTQAPVVNRWTLLSNPAPERRIQIEIWIRLDSEIQATNGTTYRCNPIEEREQINAWLESNQVITFQDSEAQYAVTVNDIKWAARANVDALNRQWNGTLWVQLNQIS